MTTSLHPAYPILLVDDEASWLRSMSLTLESEGGLNNLLTCQDGSRVPALLAEQEVSLVLLDLTMPGVSGETLLQQIREAHPELPVIIVSGRNQLETAVRCMRSGAQDYFVKGAEIDRLLVSIRRLIEISDLQAENQRLRQSVQQLQLKHPAAFEEIVTVSPKMQALFRYVEAIAGGRDPVLISGESGVGKELLAQALHAVANPRGAWVPVNAAGLDDELFMTTLFGQHGEGSSRKRGLVERARGGTLFLDEIGELGEQSQKALLRFAQSGEYLPVGGDIPWRSDARLVCATNRDLDDMVTDGRFRRDLYLRLRSHLIQIPPLRERKEDLIPLLQLFLQEAAEALNKPVPTPPTELPLLLAAYDFPGNVWELRTMVFDAVVEHTSRILSMEKFRQAMNLTRDVALPREGGEESAPPLVFPGRLPTLAEAGQLLVAEAMQRAGNNQAIAASLLGITRQALNQRLKKQI